MKIVLVLLLALAASSAQNAPEREGNFNIRFEPAAKLQTGAAVPFEITVTDALHKPLTQAKTTLQIGMVDGTNVKVFRAPEVDRVARPGIYIAKPVFPASGEYNIYVEVHRADQMSARTIQFTIPE
ncbi:MAG: FixH family protein [Acidobacteriaceae bacterium]|nr:FixH family protein [Acidobacteriaceae bacterium]